MLWHERQTVAHQPCTTAMVRGQTCRAKPHGDRRLRAQLVGAPTCSRSQGAGRVRGTATPGRCRVWLAGWLSWSTLRRSGSSRLPRWRPRGSWRRCWRRSDTSCFRCWLCRVNSAAGPGACSRGAPRSSFLPAGEEDEEEEEEEGAEIFLSFFSVCQRHSHVEIGTLFSTGPSALSVLFCDWVLLAVV